MNHFGSRIDLLDQLDVERLNRTIYQLPKVESLNSIPFAPISEKGIRDRRYPELEASGSGKGKVGAGDGDDIPTVATFGVGREILP